MATAKKITEDETIDYLRGAIEHAPPEPLRPISPLLRGWWMTVDNRSYYLCANCAARIMDRGCYLPGNTKAVWKDWSEPYGVCVCCE